MDILNKVSTIFILLGHECNMNCRYCLQHGIAEQVKKEINPRIYNFIKDVAEDRQITLQFFGGEPLIFWPNIIEITEKITEMNLNIKWNLMTNGKAINQEIVDWANKYNVWFCVSWDGPNVLETRGYNAFADDDKKKLLLSIKNLGISAVLSSKAYPLEITEAFQKIADEYNTIHGYMPYLNVDDIFDTGITPKDLLDIDVTRLSKEIEEIVGTFIEVKKLGGPIPNKDYARFRYIEKMYNSIMPYYTNEQAKENVINRDICCCGNGYTTYNLGIDGTLYHCHNCTIPCGNIDNAPQTILKNVMSFDKTKENMIACRECIALPYCHGGCKIVPKNIREESYCPLRREIAASLLNSILKLTKEEE